MWSAGSDTWTYFARIIHEDGVGWSVAVELVGALDAAHAFGQPGTIYFYSDRWGYDYETRVFLYPDTPGVDRSGKFGAYGLEWLHSGPVTYVLISPYTHGLPAIRTLHPRGEAVEWTGPYDRAFSVYHLEGGR